MQQIIKRCDSLEGLLELQSQYSHIADFRTGRRQEDGRREVLICGDTGCVANDSTEVVREFNRQLAAEGLESQVQVSVIGCFGFCVQGPIVKIMPDNTMYVKVKPEDVSDIVHQHLLDSRRVKRLLYHDPTSGRDLEHSEDFPFYKKQKRVVMRNLGLVHPEKMEESIAFRGYEALARSVCEKTPQEVIDIVRASGLRGRGGAGFPTGIKWQAAADQPGDTKYIVCNADEGDPGAFMDRAILEGDPNSVLEAMAIAGYAIGAHEGIIYIRAEYPSAIHRLKLALTQAHQYGFLGKNIFGSGFDFDITLRYGAGAFVCGEET
ncbi:MAG: NAD(P)H-dependent oxidoreductase subunit E, partial [Bacillota bacterium]|nr:NAD(P)H-dependent oxidoreductase subunit E [Bacillota bacterium]